MTMLFHLIVQNRANVDYSLVLSGRCVKNNGCVLRINLVYAGRPLENLTR